MGKGKALAILFIICFLGFVIYYATWPVKLYHRELEFHGVGKIIDTFTVYGFRNELSMKVMLKVMGIFNITIVDPKNNTVYTHQDIYGGDTYLINATISISMNGKYKIIYVTGGAFKLTIEIKGYHTITKNIPI